uniref:Uncharacterized protein n=1 Tax=viral metagenome TaxID=1070528 RepID=A0A6C0KVI5_9ZZZZ
MIRCKFVKPVMWNRMLLHQKIGYTFPYYTPEFGPYIDKIEAKRIVKEMVGDAIEVAPIVRILDGPADLRQEDINVNYIIKSSHASNRNINIKSGVEYNLAELRTKLEGFSSSYYDYLKEGQYRFVKPRFYIEEKIVDYSTGRSGSAITFMVYCIHGKPTALIMMEYALDRYRHFAIDSTFAMKQIAIRGQIYHDFKMPGDAIFNSMFTLATRLSKPFEFVRVDFYLGQDEKIYFSEFTFTPHSGKVVFPRDVEAQFGALWT